jgi:O-succinylbenzoic acid--CoA ligase
MTVLFTSGTTGKPKVVPLSSDNWRAAIAASVAHLGHRTDDQWLVAMPVHRVGGLAVLLRSAFVGARVRVLPSFEAASFADELGDATLASVVPTMLRRVLDVDDRRYQGLRAVLVGGGPIPPGLLEEAFERGIPALPTYGMTETCAQVATLKPGSPIAYKADLLPGVEARIGHDGRIALRGPQIFSGYLGEPPRAEGEWFVTGDRGSLESGALRIDGRADGVIVSGGENVDPTVVEAVVRVAAGVDDAVVIGLPSAQWGFEVVCIYTGTADPDDLDRIARDELERYEVPKRWIGVSSVPRDEMGKVDREAAIAMVEAI